MQGGAGSSGQVVGRAASAASGLGERSHGPAGVFWFSLVAAGALISCVLAGCVIERNAGEGEEDTAQEEDVPEPPPEVPPWGQPVRVLLSSPANGDEDVALDTPIWFQLDHYLDPDRIEPFSTVRVQSGGVFVGVRAQYRMVDRRIVGFLRGPLEPNFRYDLRIDHENVVSVDGSPMVRTPRITFETGSGSAPAPVPDDDAPPPTWDTVAGILAEGCGCHTLNEFPDTWFVLPALTYERMVGQPSISRPEYDLVEPFEPAKSRLMHRAIPDYPRSHDVEPMPPPWGSELESTRDLPKRTLTLDELRTIEAWIALGAQR